MAARTGRGVTRYITAEDIEGAPSGTVFVFGDNMKGIGNGGQASIARQFVPVGKAFGIPTKWSPDMEEGSFFSDKREEISAVRRSFERIRQLSNEGKKVVFFPGIGEGLAQLPFRSPEIYGMIVGFVESMSA